MSALPYSPTLDFYRRADCPPCAEARALLQQVLEDRARRGQPTPRVRYIDVDEDETTRERYGALLPVLAIAGDELSLAPSYRQIEALIERAMPRRA
jgi:glutaredoxin